MKHVRNVLIITRHLWTNTLKHVQYDEMAQLIDVSSLILAYVGAVIIFYGGAIAVIRTILLEIKKISNIDYHDIRRDFTHKIVFGLDFLIASDILKTIVAPTQQEIILLGAIVGIRTVLGYFLSKEISEFEE